MLRWPDKRTIDTAARLWAQKLASEMPEILGIAYFGSYARGDWGVGSDLDVVIVVTTSDRSFEERGRDFDTRDLPVPTDILVYTLAEWRTLEREVPFIRRLLHEAVWASGSPGTFEADQI